MEKSQLTSQVRSLYRTFGPPKAMGDEAIAPTEPLFFLLRKFLDEVDLLVIFNTKRCRYQCHYCALPEKSSRAWISEENVVAQFVHVMNETKAALGVVDRLTIANEGSVFDFATFPREALYAIVEASEEIVGLKKLIFETRIEFVTEETLTDLRARSRRQLSVLAGFETLDPEIRASVLGRRQDVSTFEAGIEILGRQKADLTAYVLYKPSPTMSDAHARSEASDTIDFLAAACQRAGIGLTVRLNPMYAATGTRWHADAMAAGSQYVPPLLSDVLAVAQEKRQRGIPVYIGLTSEGLASTSATYKARPEYTKDILKRAIALNLSAV